MLYHKYNRSLSPHLFSYKTHITSIFSIFHRITGFTLSLFLLCSPLFLVVISSFSSFFLVYSLYSILFIFFHVIFYLSLLISFFHMMNGFRHFLWDFCVGLDIDNVYITGSLISFLSLFLIFFLLIF